MYLAVITSKLAGLNDTKAVINCTTPIGYNELDSGKLYNNAQGHDVAVSGTCTAEWHLVEAQFPISF
jgi:hypothetical protein